MREKLLPHPILSGVLIVVWLLLVNSVSVAQVLLGGVFGIIIPLLTHAFWPERTPFHKPLLALRLLAIVLFDIAVANVIVARLVLGPRRALKPAFIRLPLDISNEFGIALLASAISLTPGTVTVAVSTDRRELIVHGLHVEDKNHEIKRIKSRYEKPLMEMYHD